MPRMHKGIRWGKRLPTSIEKIIHDGVPSIIIPTQESDEETAQQSNTYYGWDLDELSETPPPLNH